jgi:hypothetical protein
MAKRGLKFTFHGAFKSKRSARSKEKEVGGFVKKIRVRNHTRYAVMTKN